MSVLEILALLLGVIGILGNILPGLPGAPIALAGLFCAHFSDQSPSISLSIFIIAAILTILAVLVDYVAPMFGAKKFGGSKYGSWGAIVGLIVGLFVPPFGIVLGPLFGAILGEMYNNKQLQDATIAGIGAVLGMLASSIIKLAFTAVIFFFIIKNVF